MVRSPKQMRWASLAVRVLIWPRSSVDTNRTDTSANSFRIYRNFDGNGGQYGDTWIRSTSTDQSQLAIYGSQRSRDNALTLPAMI